MEKFYFATVKFLNSGLLGIILGLISGVAINIATADNLSRIHLLSCCMLFVSLLLTIVLIQIRQVVDQQVEGRNNESISSIKKLEAGVDLDNKKRKRSWLFCLFSAAIFFMGGIGVLIYAKRIDTYERTDIKSLQVQVRKVEDDNLKLRSEKDATIKTFNKLMDEVKKLNVPIQRDSAKKKK